MNNSKNMGINCLIENSSINQMINEYHQMLSTASQVNRLCAEAQSYFQGAIQQENRARRANKRAMWVAGSDDGGGYEMICQAKRSRNMNRAIDSAQMGSETLHRAFSLIPRGCLLRHRYPHQMKNIGTTPIPNLTGDNFGRAVRMDMMGGGAGALRNDFRAKKNIKRNLRVLQSCAQICGQQQKLLKALTNTIQTDMTRLQRQQQKQQK